MNSLTIRSPDDWHCHLREGAALAVTVVDQAKQFSRAMVMPNLKQPIVTTAMAIAYRKSIMQAVPDGTSFTPLMTLYLHPGLSVVELESAKNSGCVIAVKFYPRGATTLSEHGVVSWRDVIPQLKAMEALGLVLAVHGEVVDAEIDIFEREGVFLTRELAPILENFPRLKVVLEHVSTAKAVDFVYRAGEQLGATITAHHLLLDRNDLLVGGVKPHNYCLPILKTRQDREALIEAATGGCPRFFLGTDSAPHKRSAKQSACGCAGIYSANAALPYYAEVFDAQGALGQLENFASVFGAEFYGLPLNTSFIQLKRCEWHVESSIEYDGDVIIPLLAGQLLQWKKVRV